MSLTAEQMSEVHENFLEKISNRIPMIFFRPVPGKSVEDDLADAIWRLTVAHGEQGDALERLRRLTGARTNEEALATVQRWKTEREG